MGSYLGVAAAASANPPPKVRAKGGKQENVDYLSINVDGGGNDDIVKQREQLQHLEVNLKPRLIARLKVMGMQERFDSQMKEHITSSVKLLVRLAKLCFCFLFMFKGFVAYLNVGETVYFKPRENKIILKQKGLNIFVLNG